MGEDNILRECKCVIDMNREWDYTSKSKLQYLVRPLPANPSPSQSLLKEQVRRRYEWLRALVATVFLVSLRYSVFFWLVSPYQPIEIRKYLKLTESIVLLFYHYHYGKCSGVSFDYQMLPDYKLGP